MKEYNKTYQICKPCGKIIEEGTGLCEYGCPNDGELVRPKGQLIQRIYRVIETIIEEKEI